MIKTRLITKSKAKPFAANILNLNKFEFPLNVQNDISRIFAKYFIQNSNWSLVYYDDQHKSKPIGWLAASINFDPGEVILDQDKIIRLIKKYNNNFLTQFMIFQARITDTIHQYHEPNEFNAELIAFSCLKKHQGIGTKLINEYENYLKLLKIDKYCLFTDDNCDYEWYIRHFYKMVGKYQIQTDDLNYLFKPNTKYYVYKFVKEL